MRGMFLGRLRLWAGVLLLAGCRAGQPAPDLSLPVETASLTPPARTATPLPPSLTPSATPTITPTPDPYGWNPVGLEALDGMLASGTNPQCVAIYPDLGAGELLLGADPQTCAPLPGRSEVRLQVSAAGLVEPGGWLALGVECLSGGACLYAAQGAAQGAAQEAAQEAAQDEEALAQARFEIALPEGGLVWAGDCSQPGLCAETGAGGDEDPRAVQITLRHAQPGPLEIVLAVQGGAVWRLASVQSLNLPPLPEGLVQGYAYSPYRDCQMPDIGPFPSQAELAEDLQRLAHSANAIRTYSTQGINADIARLAAEQGLQVAVGVALSADPQKSQAEIEAARSLAQQIAVDYFIVGNEIILRGELTPQQVADYMLQVREQTGRPVAYAEIGSFFVQADGAGGVAPRPDMLPIIQAADILLVHLYPYWDGIPVEQGAAYVLGAYQALQAAFPEQRVIIGETGWPSRGEARGPAVPSPENQRRFFYEFTSLAAAYGMEYYYFSPFEEPWKANEGGVGPSWGVATVGRVNKFESESPGKLADCGGLAHPGGSCPAAENDPTPTNGPTRRNAGRCSAPGAVQPVSLPGGAQPERLAGRCGGHCAEPLLAR